MIRRSGSDPFALHQGCTVSLDVFLRDVAGTARRLPDGDCLINACDDRYRFLVGFFAALVGGRTNLLPPNRAPETLRRLADEFQGAGTLTDDSVLLQGRADAEPSGAATAPDVRADLAAVADSHVAAIAFTSGSTGRPQPHRKPWGALAAGAAMHAARLGLREPAVLVATVPPWHMYGLEWSVLVAMRAPVVLYCGETFYPADVLRALGAHAGRRVLVTTPIHLRALLRSGSTLPQVDTVISATAPLERSLAEAAEQRLAARLLEIYGCSEVGTLAHRDPTRDEPWSLFPGFTLAGDGDAPLLAADFLAQPVALADRLEIHADGRFRLLGRQGDLVKVGGKRASLTELTARLLAVPGVRDAVIVESDAAAGSAGGRLCAFVVAPGATADGIRRQLAAVVDPVFLPRPLKLVDALPRTATGKLTRETLTALLEPDPAER